jgi:hypothetical protein
MMCQHQHVQSDEHGRRLECAVGERHGLDGSLLHVRAVVARDLAGEERTPPR